MPNKKYMGLCLLENREGEKKWEQNFQPKMQDSLGKVLIQHDPFVYKTQPVTALKIELSVA